MLALIGMVCFLLALFGVHVGTVNLVTAGLVFVAGHLVWDTAATWRARP